MKQLPKHRGHSSIASNQPVRPKQGAWSLIKKGIIAAALAKGTAIVASFAFQLIAVRWVGLHEYGMYAAQLNWLVLGSVLGTGGADIASTRILVEVGTSGMRPRHYFRSTLFRLQFIPFVCITSLFTISGMALFGALPRTLVAVVIGVSFIFFQSTSAVLGGLLRAQHQVFWAQLVSGGLRVVVAVLFVVIAVILECLAPTSESLVQIQLAGVLVAVIVGWYTLGRPRVHSERIDSFVSYIPSRIRAEAGSAFIIAVANVARTRAPVIVTGILLDARATAGLAIASQLAAFVATGPQLVNPIVAPMLAGERDSDGRLATVSLARRAMWLVSGGIALGLLVLGPSLLALFAPDLQSFYWVLAVLSTAELVSSGVGPVTNALIMTGSHGIAGRIATIWLAPGLLALVVGARVAGPLGVALGAALWTVGVRVSMFLAWRARV